MQLLWIFIGCATGFLQLSPKLWEPIRHAVDMKIQWTAFRRFQSLGCIFWADDSVRIVLACFWPKRFPESRGEQRARVFHTEKKLTAYQKLGYHTTTDPSCNYLGCWLVTLCDWHAQVNFDGVAVNWTPWAYLYRKGRGSQRWCYSFQDSEAVRGDAPRIAGATSHFIAPP